ncbi:MAG TPA: TonB-dependent receptor [Rhodocyclaceae bacterium]
MSVKKKIKVLLSAGMLGVTQVWAAGVPTLTLDTVEINAEAQGLIGSAASANEGTVTAQQLEHRPLLRAAEVLEVMPGLVVSQHAGDGKANQYYLRGFNLDHGTDFATTLLGMPVNLPSHAHGQGYTDLNFLIPELVERMNYRKGPYWAEEGDFSSAGAAHIEYFRQIERPFADVTLGADGYRRTLLAGSPAVGDGRLLYGLEVFGNDGPWLLPEGLQRLNGLLRYGWGRREEGGSVALLAYDTKWRSTDQVPQRALANGSIDRFGYVDPSDGGRSHRYSLSVDWAGTGTDSKWQANAYAIDYGLDLFSNFTYATLQPAHSDQFEQVDQRHIYGGSASRSWIADWNGRLVESSLGVQARLDRIGKVGLFLSDARQRWATVREDAVDEDYYALYGQTQVQWSDWFRSQFGMRGDFQRYRVDSDRPQNSGSVAAHLWSPKLALVFGPWQRTEFYADYGFGFHSNDARGALTRLNPDPRDLGFLSAVAPVTPLVRSRGAELGARSAPLPGLQLTAALWQLEIGSELLFTGDAGTTEPSRPSRRNGIELSAYWALLRGLTLDGDLSLSRSRYTQDDPLGNYIPGSVERVASLGVDYVPGGEHGPWSFGLRLRHFGARPLIEDDSVRSKPSTLVNVQAGYQLGRDVKLRLDVLNLFDHKVSDIDYYYASQLKGEAAAVNDIHTHPAEPRTLRFSVRLSF